MMAVISANPTVAMSSTPSTDMGSPVTTKSFTLKYGRRKSSTISNELTFGNDENGSAIAAETANADPITTTSGSARETPMRAMIGMRMMEATVCDTNVATVAEKNSTHSRANHGCCNGSAKK